MQAAGRAALKQKEGGKKGGFRGASRPDCEEPYMDIVKLLVTTFRVMQTALKKKKN